MEEPEVWKDIPSLPDYQASTWGRVMRKPYTALMPKGGERTYGGVPHPGVWCERDKVIPDTLRRFSLRSRPPQHAHRITRLHTPTVITLIFRGERGRDWGFWCPPADYVNDTGAVIVSRVNNPTREWKWVYWRDYLDITDPEQGEAY